MTSKLKKVLALGLVVLVGVVWIPQIITAQAKRGGAGNSSATAINTSSRPSAVESGASADRDDLAHALEASVARARLVAPESFGIDLSELASAWTASAATSTAVSSPENTPIDQSSAQAPVTPVVVELASQDDPIDTFLATHPLRGTLIGATQRRACLGPLLVAVGDELVKGLVVSAIEPRFVTFRRAGVEMRADLIPFQARAPSVHASASSSSGDKLLPLLQQAPAAVTTSGATAAAQDKQPAPIKSSKDGQGP